jgi:hypothetical protein
MHGIVAILNESVANGREQTTLPPSTRSREEVEFNCAREEEEVGAAEANLL